MHLLLLTWFICALFSLFRSKKSPVAQKRISNIIEYLTFEIHSYSVRGLYENHKFLFTLLLALKIDIEKGHVENREFQTLIRGKFYKLCYV